MEIYYLDRDGVPIAETKIHAQISQHFSREYQKFCVRGDFQRVATSHSFVFRTCVFSVSSVKGNALVRSPRRIISAAPSHAMARGCRSGERLISVPL